MKISDLPKECRPREKAKLYGIEKLNEKELLAIIISRGVKNKSVLEISDSLLNEYGTLFNLSKARTITLKKQFGLNEITALKLEAIFEIYNRLNVYSLNNKYRIKCPYDIYRKYKYLSEENREILLVIMLNNKKEIIREKILYLGSENCVPLNIRELAVELLQINTKYYVLVHNHPDNFIKPSQHDIDATIQIKEAIDCLSLTLLDHIIICSNSYFSFKEHKILK